MSLHLSVKEGQQVQNSIVIHGKLDKGDTPELFNTITSRNAVIAFARANGLPTASGLGDFARPFPTDAEGNYDEDLMTGKRKFDHFEAEYTVNAGL